METVSNGRDAAREYNSVAKTLDLVDAADDEAERLEILDNVVTKQIEIASDEATDKQKKAQTARARNERAQRRLIAPKNKKDKILELRDSLKGNGVLKHELAITVARRMVSEEKSKKFAQYVRKVFLANPQK